MTTKDKNTLKILAKEQNTLLQNKSIEEILLRAKEVFKDKIVMTTAFGKEGMILIHLIAHLKLNIEIINIDTGYQFQETLDMCNTVKQRYQLTVKLARPSLSTHAYEQGLPAPLYKTDPDRCCYDRKITVLRQTLEGKEAWLTAIRQEQTPERAKASLIAWDQKFSCVKINPLIHWTKQEVENFTKNNDIPCHPLYDQGFPSIGCRPCTRSVTKKSKNDREGRWPDRDKRECGLHTE